MNNLKLIYEEDQKMQEEEKKKVEEIKSLEEQRKTKYLEKIQYCGDFEYSLDYFCEELKQLSGATGCYLMSYEKKRKLKVSDEDDENAHLLEDMVLRYINYCDDHEFLRNKFLEPGTGVCYELVTPKEEETKPADEGTNAEGKENDTTPKEPKHKEVQEVVGSDEGAKIKFFKEPRLGCFLAVDVSYNTSLSKVSLESAIENQKDYEKNCALQEERRKEYEARMAELEKERHEMSGEGKNPDDAAQDPSRVKEEYVEEKVILQDYKKFEKKMILCLDTLGQDRIFTAEQKKFIFDTVNLIKASREKFESQLLLKDRDTKMEIDTLDLYLKEQYNPDKLESEEEKYVREYFGSEKYLENPITDERTKAIETEYRKTRYNIYNLKNDDNMKNIFLMYSTLEFVEFEKLFQNILYFIGCNNKDINEENTNKLDWKKARKFWDISVIDKLIAYKPFGPKSKPSSFAMGNRLLPIFESINKEDLKAYSFVLLRLLEFIILLLKVRRDDILRRRDVVNELLEKRRIAIEEQRVREEKREQILEDERKKYAEMEEGSEPLNEEEFLSKWDEENPQIVIPDEVQHDVDDDFEVEKLSA